MKQDKDRGGKWYITHHGNAILKLARMVGVTSWKATANEVVAPRRSPDGLLEVTFAGNAKPELVLIEIESYPGSDVDNQVFEDILLVRVDRKVMPRVISLILHPKGNQTVEGRTHETDSSGTVELTGRWPVIKLWELEAEELFAAGDVGLIPWVPLAKSNLPPEELLTRCRDRIAEVQDESDRKGLTAVTQIMAGLAFPDRRFLNLFGGAEAMIESPVLEEAKELIRVRAVAETRRNDVLESLEIRFGKLPPIIGISIKRGCGHVATS